MILDRIFIRDGRVILQDCSGGEVALLPEDAIDFMEWVYTHHSQLQWLIHHAPPIRPRADTIESFLRHERRRTDKEGEV